MLLLSKIYNMHFNRKIYLRILHFSQCQCCNYSTFIQLEKLCLKSHKAFYSNCFDCILLNPHFNISKTLSYSSYLLNFYDILGIKRDASKEEIKNAYFKQSKIYHPDKLLQDYKNHDVKDFLQIKEAFDVLSNDKRRLEYDMKTFGRSSDLNRFSTGEYTRYSTPFNERTSKKDVDDIPKEKPLEKSSLRRLFSLLSQVYFVIFISGIALYALGSKYRQSRKKE